MASGPRISEASLIGGFAACILYGVNLVIATGTIRVFFCRIRQGSDCVLFLLVATQFLFATVHIFALFQQLVVGFTRSEDPDIYFGNQSSSAHIVQEAAYLTNVSTRALLCDASNPQYLRCRIF